MLRLGACRGGRDGTFYRLDADAGCVNRAIFYGRLRIVDGELHSRMLRLAIVPPATASAKP